MENSYIVGVAHIGIAVPDIKAAAAQYSLLGFKAITPDIQYEKEHGVQAYMMENAGFCIELLAPLEPGKPSPVDGYLDKKPYTIYHIAYRVSDLEAQIALLKTQKFMLLGEPKKTSLQEGKRACFMANRKLGVVELVEA